MLELLGTSVEKWRGEYPPEVGNIALAGNIRHENPRAFGVVTEVLDGGRVAVAWSLRTKRRKRPHRENKRHNAARRVVVQDALDAASAHYENGEREKLATIARVIQDTRGSGRRAPHDVYYKEAGHFMP